MLADQINPIERVAVVAAVVVGNETVVDPYAVSHVRARAAVVDEATVMMSFCPSVGVPDGLLNLRAPV